jgi:Tol biopolymer transport system component
MNADGSNQKQITQTEGVFPLLVSPDGKWLYYHQNITKTLGRVSVNGGHEELILDKRKDYLAISPDATRVAFAENQGDQRFLQIVSMVDGQISKTLPLADPKAVLTVIAWLPDGKSLAYILAENEYQNYTLWLQPLEGKARKLTDLGHEEITSLKFAPDGKNYMIAQGGWQCNAVLLKGLK